LQRHRNIADLPLCARDAAVRETIDRWLITNAAFISSSQAGQAVANSPIHTEGPTIVAYRPSAYGRALVVSVGNDDSKVDSAHPPQSALAKGLLDLKGAGISPGRTPSREEHSNGLEYLGVALADLAMQKVIDEIFRRAAPSFRTVPVYAVLDLGFDILQAPTFNAFRGLVPGPGWDQRGMFPAGMHVRRAHRRPLYGMDLPSSGSPAEIVKFEIEMLLRNYGLTSTTIGTALDIRYKAACVQVFYNRQPVTGLNTAETQVVEQLRRSDGDEICLEGVNVQLAREVQLNPSSGQVVDFGQFNVRPFFEHAVASLVRDRPLHLGGVMWPDDPAFIRPDPELALPLEKWERMTLNSECFDMAEQFRRGALSSADVACRLESCVYETTRKWPP